MTPARVEQFWSLVDKAGPTVRAELGPCWIWMGALLKSRKEQHGRYGRFGRSAYAHRIALELTQSTVLSSDQHALHHCDNPPCCNPAHLYIGTPSDNMKDAARRNRLRPPRFHGESNPFCKYTDSEVARVLDLRRGGMSTRAIARATGMSQTHVRAVAGGRARNLRAVRAAQDDLLEAERALSVALMRARGAK
jgi:hypothetical protein